DTVRAIVAPYIPSGTVPMLAGLGILALEADLEGIAKLRGEASLSLPSPSAWNGERSITTNTSAGPVALAWLAIVVARSEQVRGASA
ncbi:MAG TPA: hypothetical protein VF294_09815, partial [Polyangiaceae bacterium]